MRDVVPFEQDAIVGEAGEALGAARDDLLRRLRVDRRLVMHRRMRSVPVSRDQAS
jgi:hypothetical protein